MKFSYKLFTLHTILLLILSSIAIAVISGGDWQTFSDGIQKYALHFYVGYVLVACLALAWVLQYRKNQGNTFAFYRAKVNLYRSVFLAKQSDAKKFKAQHHLTEFVFNTLNRDCRYFHDKDLNLNSKEYELTVVVTYPKIKFIVTNKLTEESKEYSEITFSADEKIKLYCLITDQENPAYYNAEV